MSNQLLAVNLRERFFGSNTGAGIIGNSPGSLLSNLIPNLLIAAGLLFLFIILIGGFYLLSNAGSGNTQETAKDKLAGKLAITYGVIGFLIVVCGYFILQIVGYSLGIDFTNLPANLN